MLKQGRNILKVQPQTQLASSCIFWLVRKANHTAGPVLADNCFTDD